MEPNRHRNPEIRNPTAAIFLPPALVDETGWDILLALYKDQRGELALRKLASLASVPVKVMDRWLARLEERDLIAGAVHGMTGEIRARLTRSGRELLDHYLSATSGLQARAHC